MKKNFSTPILFLVYNRPETTKIVFSEIKKIKPLKLYVAADGPRNDKDKELIAKVRKIIDDVDWDCEIKYLFREKNMGCKMAVSSAISWFFENEEKGIILEDDCLPNRSFFLFQEEMLNKYKDDERIMMVSGTNHMIENPDIDSSYFFSRHFTIWGWGTWRRAWGKYDLKIKSWKVFKKNNQLKSITSGFFVRKHFETNFDLIEKDIIDTWDIQWVFTCLFNNGLNIVPKVNLISNIGVDGTHSSEKTNYHFYKLEELDIYNLKHPKYVFPDSYFDIELHNLNRKPTIKRLVFMVIRDLPFYKQYLNLKKKIKVWIHY